MGGRRGSPPTPRPHGVRHGIRQGGEKVRVKEELTSGSRVAVKQGVVNGSWAGWLCWAERIGGLAVCAGLRCKMEGVLQTSTDVVKAQSGRDGFPIF
jgi:hypothetical protein